MLKLRNSIDQAFWCLSVSGVWEQPFWSYWHKFLFRIFSKVLFTITFTVELSLLMAIFFPDEKTSTLQELLYLLLPYTNGIIKYLNVNLKRRTYLKLIEMTRQPLGRLQNPEEEMMSLKYDKIMRFVATYCFFFAHIPGVTHALMPLMDTKARKLTANSWFPYDFTKTVPFYLTVFWQGLGTLSMAAFSMSNDVLAVAVNLHLCTQIKIMCRRMQNTIKSVEEGRRRQVPSEEIHRLQSKAIKQFVHHHRAIYQFVEYAQSCMNAPIISQYCCGAFLVCFSTYKLTEGQSSFYEKFSSLCYFISMVNEIGLYCVPGNEVVLESSKIVDRLCGENWGILNTKTLKSMLIILMRTKNPIEIKVGPLISLSNTAFVKILKLAYSMFNLVRQKK